MMAPVEYLKRPYARVVVPEGDGTYRGEILEFPGCIASGDTAPEALARLEDVAESWLESVLARGQAVPEPFEENDYSGKLVLRLAKSVHQKAARAAHRDGVSLNTFISNCVAEHLGGRKTAPAQHFVTNYSQQNHMLILGSDVTYMKTGQTVSSSSGTSVFASKPTSLTTKPNPWNKTDA